MDHRLQQKKRRLRAVMCWFWFGFEFDFDLRLDLRLSTSCCFCLFVHFCLVSFSDSCKCRFYLFLSLISKQKLFSLLIQNQKDFIRSTIIQSLPRLLHPAARSAHRRKTPHSMPASLSWPNKRRPRMLQVSKPVSRRQHRLRPSLPRTRYRRW